MLKNRISCALLALTMLCAMTACTKTPANTADGTTMTSTTAATTATVGGAPSAWGETTTTYPFSVTESVNGAPAEEQLGYIQNENGTLTDNMSGVVFLDDSLSSLSVGAVDCLAQETNGLAVLRADGGLFGDTTLAAATDANAFVTYHLKSGIADAAVTVYAPADVEKGEEFTLFASADGQSWTALTHTSHEPEQQQGGFVRRAYHFFDLPDGTCYLKVQLTAPDKGALSPVRLGRVRVGNVQKMYYPLERLEDRAAATFYVDAQNGDDQNDGLSPQTAYQTLQKISSRFFRPGDRILFKRGCTFVGNASLKGLGLAAHRLYIGAYGEGKDPIIAANGGAALSVQMDYVTVENLEVTNPNGLQGIEIAAAHTGANKGIAVQNCYIHDINVNAAYFGYDASAVRAKVQIRTAPTWFEGITVRQNTVKNTARCAVYMDTAWADRHGVGWGCSREFYKDDHNGWWPIENIAITDNTIHTVQGDAILVIGGRGVNVARNQVFDAYAIASETLAVHASGGANKACATIWTINCNDVYLQYNEVGYTNFPAGGADAEGYDIDCGQKNVWVQYNYSHNNAGGFLLICDTDGCRPISEGTTHTVRYNLSVDDNGQGVFMAVNTVAKLDIYNNTIIQRSTRTYGLYIFGNVQSYHFRNNIFSGQRAGLVCVGYGIETKDMLFDNNIYTDGAYLPHHVFYGSRFPEAAERGFTVTASNRSEENLFVNGAHTATDTFTPDRTAAVAAFTPQIWLGGAYKTPSAVDINGDKIEAPFYGCVKPLA